MQDEVSGFESNKDPKETNYPNVLEEIKNNNRSKMPPRGIMNSSSSGCLQNPSDLISPSYFYSNDGNHQLEFENNSNELLSNPHKQ